MFYKLLLTLFLILSSGLTPSYGQKEDYIWLLGYSEEIEPPDSNFGGINFDFNKIPMEVKYIKRKNHFWHTNASICDTNGELLCFTNGIYIGNKGYDIMDNGTNIHKWRNRGYGLEQGAIILPYPGHKDQFFAIQGSWERFWVNGKSKYRMRDFRYSLVDMTLNKGLGQVLIKNNKINESFMNFGMLTACMHGNGEDWWLPVVKKSSDTILMFVLDENGIELDKECIVNRSLRDGVGSATFTPDGTKYVNVRTAGTIHVGYNVDIFDFDRCSGELYNHVFFVDDPVIDTSFSVSIAVSPNSRYLYITNTWHIFQYDLESVDIQDSRITVAKWDGFFDLNPTAFDKMQLAPDGKLYVSAPGGSHYFHVIHAPDSAGVDCRVEQRAIMLPAWNNGTIPNFPHFRMGKLTESPCDTVTSSVDLDEEERSSMTISPNPSSGIFDIRWTGEKSSSEYVEVWDNRRLFVRTQKLNGNGITELDLTTQSSGIYFIVLKDENGRIIDKQLIGIQK